MKVDLTLQFVRFFLLLEYLYLQGLIIAFADQGVWCSGKRESQSKNCKILDCYALDIGLLGVILDWHT